MRNFVLVSLMLSALLKTQAQDYLLSFSGMGDTTGFSTVKVDNLTKGTSVSLKAGEDLHLKSVLGIEMLDIENTPLRLFPNPMSEQSILTFVASEEGNAVISLVDISGKTIYQKYALLSKGTYRFSISGVRPGFYILKVTGKNFIYSTKLVSAYNFKSEANIEFFSFDGITSLNHPKSNTTAIDMQYTDGDLLLFKGTAGPYNSIITDIPNSSKTITFNFISCNDYDGNNYSTVGIGEQVWMAENLKTKHYSDGTEIALVESTTDWGNLNYTDKAYCFYENSLATANTYGTLYTWSAAMNGALSNNENPGFAQGACPCGWHLPSDKEWVELEMFLGMSYEDAYFVGWRGTDQGDQLKSASGWMENGNGTNSSGFSALPAGSRINTLFSGLNQTTVYWSSTEYFNNHTLAFNRSLSYMYSQVGFFSASHYYGYPKNFGLSVRCIKD